MARLARAILLACAACLLAACSALPVVPDKAASTALVAADDAPLPSLARSLAVPDGLSAVRPLPLAHDAVAARLALIAQAQRSIDLQTFLLADDSVGHLMLRALRDAAERGVRVRVLLDDFYTLGLDELLLGLAAHPNVELRLYNPFTGPRDAQLVSIRAAGRRLPAPEPPHAQQAVPGRRGVRDRRRTQSRRRLFHAQRDRQLHRFRDARRGGAGARAGAQLRRLLEQRARDTAARGGGQRASMRPACARTSIAPPRGPMPPRPGRPPSGRPRPRCWRRANPPAALRPDGSQPEPGLLGFFIAPATAHADPPLKLREHGDAPGQDSVAAQLVRTLAQVQREIILVTPYFVPGQFGMERIRELRARGVDVRIVTNATAASDMPVVGIGYERHRAEMLRLGVRLFEVSDERIKHDGRLRRLFKSSSGRLHAKMGFVDRQVLLVGSLNLDARSALINTEIGIRVEDPALVQALLDFYGMESATRCLRTAPEARWTEHRVGGP